MKTLLFFLILLTMVCHSLNAMMVTDLFTREFLREINSFLVIEVGSNDFLPSTFAPVQMYYADGDGDSFGNPNADTVAVGPLPGYVSDNTDCNDNNAAIHPGAAELCNGIDDDCSGVIDDHIATDPSIVWEKSFGGTNDDELNAMDKTLDGGYILAGSSYSNSGDLTGNKGKSDAWIVKIDNGGTIAWQKNFGGGQIESANAIEQTSDSGYVVACTSESHNGDVSANHGGSDFWIVRLDKSGNLVWQKNYGGSSDDVVYDIDETFDGGFVAAGYSRSSDGDLSGNHSNGDYWIIRLDATGNLMWQKAYGGSAYDFAHTVVQSFDGGFVVSGYARSTDGDVIGNHGQEDVWILKLDSMGNPVWQKSYGGTGGEGASSLQRTSDGGYIIAGITHSYNIDVVGNHGLHDFWVLKIDSVGNLQWKKCLGGTDTDDGNNVRQTRDAGYIVVGVSDSNDGDATFNHGLHDYWVVKLNASGSVEWQKSLGGSQDDEATDVVENGDGSFTVAGFSSSNDGDVSGNHGSGDFWVLKITPPPAIKFYRDVDEDGYGDPNNSVVACFAPNGYVANSSDCSDSNANINPGVYDICNGIDDDCDSYIDENSVVASISPLSTLTICNTSTLTYTCNTGEGYTYQWQRNSVNIDGATNSSYTASSGGTYSVVITNRNCVSNSPGSVLKTTNKLASVVPAGATSVCPGTSLTFGVTAKPGITFQWKNSSGAITGATSPNFVTSAPGDYFVTESDITGCSFNSSTSTLQNYPDPNVKIQLSGSLNICNTGSVTFMINPVSGYIFQWYKDNSTIVGATVYSYTATAAGSYKALVTSVNGCTKFSAIKTVSGCRVAEAGETSTVTATLSCYPNPSNGNFNFKLQGDVSFDGQGTAVVYNSLGEIVTAQKFDVADNLVQGQMSLPEDVKPGLYFFRFVVEDHEYTSAITIVK